MRSLVGSNRIPMSGIKWSMHAVSIQLARMRARDEDVPVVVRSMDEWIQANDSRRTRVIFVIEEQQVDEGRVP